MPADQRQLIATFRDQVLLVEERYDGYRKDLLETAIDVLADERSHRANPTTIQKQVTDKADRLGRLITNKRS